MVVGPAPRRALSFLYVRRTVIVFRLANAQSMRDVTSDAGGAHDDDDDVDRPTDRSINQTETTGRARDGWRDGRSPRPRATSRSPPRARRSLDDDEVVDDDEVDDDDDEHEDDEGAMI